jgi:hypothetical protein
MSLRGFWNKHGAALVRRTQFAGSQLTATPKPSPAEETWRTHPDQEAVARADKALCLLPKVERRDG